MNKITAIVNAFTKKTILIFTFEDYTFSFEMEFSELDEWYHEKINKDIYSIHFHYDEQLFLCVYKNVEDNGYINEKVKLLIANSDEQFEKLKNQVK